MVLATFLSENTDYALSIRDPEVSLIDADGFLVGVLNHKPVRQLTE